MAQIWAHTAAHNLGKPRVETFSGGTEATAFDSRAVAALARAGFRVDTSGTGDNPVYRVRFSDDTDPMECFSKVYDRPPNPTQDFLAVMTCSQAGVISRARDRISLAALLVNVTASMDFGSTP